MKIWRLNNHNPDKYIDTGEFNKYFINIADIFKVRLTQANLKIKKSFNAKLS